MALTQDQVRHIAKLSRLALSNEQLEHYRQNLDSIVAYMDILQSVPSEKLEGVQLSGLQMLPMREDRVEDSTISRASLLAVSPQKKIA